MTYYIKISPCGHKISAADALMNHTHRHHPASSALDDDAYDDVYVTCPQCGSRGKLEEGE